MGLVSPRTVIQIGSIDEELLTDLWNFFYVYLLEPFRKSDYFSSDNGLGLFFKRLWTSYFNKEINKFPKRTFEIEDHLSEFFLRFAKWYETYDFLESCIPLFVYLDYQDSESFCLAINSILENNMSGYRFVSGVITPIIDEKEIETIESAITNTEINSVIRKHLQDALLKLSDRDNPDFRNSIKESISAVEAYAIKISGNPKAMLSSALDSIERTGKVKFHKALKNGFSSIYGWTSDDQGIRHALQDEPTLDSEDAIFMLVACSAFINYLLVKSTKA